MNSNLPEPTTVTRQSKMLASIISKHKVYWDLGCYSAAETLEEAICDAELGLGRIARNLEQYAFDIEEDYANLIDHHHRRCGKKNIKGVVIGCTGPCKYRHMRLEGAPFKFTREEANFIVKFADAFDDCNFAMLEDIMNLPYTEENFCKVLGRLGISLP